MELIRFCTHCGHKCVYKVKRNFDTANKVNGKCVSCSKIGICVGERNGMFGKPRTDEVKQTISDKLTGRKIPQDIVDIVTAKIKGKKRTTEQRLRYSAAAKLRISNGWNPHNQSLKITKIEQLTAELLNNLKLTFIAEYQLDGRFFDFYIPDYSILIECDGNYWHGKGLLFSDMNEIQKNHYKVDLIKNQIAIDNELKLLRFWEDEIMKNINYVKTTILETINERS